MNHTSRAKAVAARMRKRLLPKLTDSCILKVRTRTPDSHGGGAEKYATSATVACHLEETNAQIEREINGKVMRVSVFDLHIPSGTVITLQHRVSLQSQEFEVVDLGAPVSLEPLRIVHLAIVQ